MTQNSINAEGLASGTVAGADEIIFYDNDDSDLPKKTTAQDIADLATESLTWSEVTGTSQAMAIENAYIANNAGLVTCTLPASAAIGDRVAVVGKGTGLFAIAQNAGQTVHFDGVSTTTGAGGSITAQVRYDCLELVCITANTDWVVRCSVGNFTIV